MKYNIKKRKSEEELEKLLMSFTESIAGEASRGMEPNSEEIDSLSEEQALEKLEQRNSDSSLLETIRIISATIQPKQLPPEFAFRVSQAVQDRFQEQMSRAKIQRIIGMAVTMEDFRKSLFQDVIATCRSVGLNLTPKEIAALRNLKEDAVNEFANSLDERITKFFPANLP